MHIFFINAIFLLSLHNNLFCMNISNTAYIDQDSQKNIIYRLDLLDQQKYRRVCSQWKKIVDNDPSTKKLESYFVLLRNPKPNHTVYENGIRVLLGAMHNKELCLVETILQCFKRMDIIQDYYTSGLKENFHHYNVCYNLDRFFQDEATRELVKKYRPRTNYTPAGQSMWFHALIMASFLDNTVKLQEIASFLQKKFTDPRSSLATGDRRALQKSFIILADYDCDKSMSAMVQILKGSDFLSNFFNDLVVISHQLKSLKVLKVLLSSGIDINQANKKNHTIKDMILGQSKKTNDDAFTATVNSLLDKYGAKTYEEVLKYNNLKSIMVGGVCIGAAAIIWYYLFHSKST